MRYRVGNHQYGVDRNAYFPLYHRVVITNGWDKAGR